MNSLKLCGLNLRDRSDEKLFDFKEIPINHDEPITVYATSCYEFTMKGNKLEIKSSLMRSRDQTLEFKDAIRKVCSSNEICWILLDNGSLFTFDLFNDKFECTEVSVSEEIYTLLDISCTFQSLFGVNSLNHLYQFSTKSSKKIHEFPKHHKIKKIVSGAEHLILMSSNGDVFSFGCGLRGALGHGDVSSCEIPKQIEALAGLKIIDVSAGSFHSIAVSSFGDVYSWGWNTKGQLGLPVVAQNTFKTASKNRQQVFTTPMLLKLDDEEGIKNVYCGSKHTIIRSERNRLFAAGLNSYGQLGLSAHEINVDKFTEIPVKDINEKTKVSCGYWSTYLINS